MPGTAPEAHIWIAVEQDAAWGDAPLARAGYGVRVVMVRGPQGGEQSPKTQRTAPARVWVADVRDGAPVRLGHVPNAADVGQWDLGAVAAGSLRTWGRVQPGPVLLVCANGRRDRCCGHDGRRLAAALWRGPHRSRVLTSTHLGGHRFAPTALMLPTGALHGRLDDRSAAALLVDADAGLAPSASLRGFSGLPSPAQVAEAHARTLTGHRGGSALPVRLLAQGEPDRLRAHVLTPAPAAQEIVVELALRTESVLPACGRAYEEMPRWVVA